MDTPWPQGKWRLGEQTKIRERGNDFPGREIDLPDGTSSDNFHYAAIEIWHKHCDAIAHLIIAAPKLHDDLQNLVEAVQYTPLGVRGIKAVESAMNTLQELQEKITSLKRPT